MSRAVAVLTRAVTLLIAASAATAFAADEAAHRCAAVEDPAARLACFDEVFARPAEKAATKTDDAAPVAPAIPADAAPDAAAEAMAPSRAAGRGEPTGATPGAPEPAAAPEALDAEAAFGLSNVQARAKRPERKRESLDRIEATVVDLRHFSTGERLIALDNGQVWLQTEATVRGPLVKGDRVVIRKGAFSSFQMVTPGRVALRVRRLE